MDLANSSICSFGPNFFSKLTSFTQLCFLNVSGNKLKDFNQDIKQTNLSEMYLSGNPIDCHCDMFWLAQWLNTTKAIKIVKDYEKIKCAGGEWNKNQVYKLTKEQMGCLPIIM